MDNAQILERLESLETLIDKTEPDIPNEKDLFSTVDLSVGYKE
jgi:hypothetical protein